MKKGSKKEVKKETKEFGADLTFINDAFAVSNVNNYSDDVCFFDLYVKTEIGLLVIYSCKIIEGSKGPFIAFPASEGKNGKYYNHAWIKMSDDTISSIIDAVTDQV